ncbi:MAG: siderophore-interacting protein [Micrococcus sp.]|nr:siderophore-interacting protein [Micrococcus sp.]
MGSHHGTGHRTDGERHESGPRAAPDTAPGAEAGADVGGLAAVDAAYGRYREARDRYAEAKYEYKAAKYALKAARLRAEREAGGGGDRRGRDRYDHDRHDHDRHRAHREHHRHDDGRRPGGGVAPGRDREAGRDDRHGDRKQRGRGQVVMQVVETERIGEHVQRLTLGGDGFEDFRDNDCTDKYVKILFVDPALGLDPPYDVQGLRKTLPRHQRPVRRTYTVHSVDPVTRTLAIDVVLHGDVGVAGPWAVRVQVGDPVAFSGPGGKYAPDPGADWHLFVGDESALPAITAALAALPSDAVGTALLEVSGPADEQLLEHPDGVEVRWLHREPGAPEVAPARPSGDAQAGMPGEETPGEETAVPPDDAGTARPEADGAGPAARPARGPSPLVAAVEGMDWRPGRVHAFVHGDKSVVKRLRGHLLDARGVDKRMLSLSSYWTRGRSGD